ncbi:MAG: putative deoxyguanosinetriphosphate triphosphohydrolase [Actinobacteria bacterium]|nr:putative deoxyguanosinetriphosphate triphosphohydrolase [Actinomycetota bacterium]
MDTRRLTFVREQIEAAEETRLSPYAMRSARSRGRQVPEEPHPLRTAFQRDRDRILHAKAFRRLAHKTQVFLAPEGDHLRVRLTHTLEVTQVARTIARALQLNEDLAEAICLGHDLGHTPFGHLGEDVLSEFLGRPFRHNEQSLRIVDCLETRAGHPGLNLTWEVRDGILNHTWSMPPPATLEAQIARYADRIAYVNHDIDDALRAGVLRPGDLPDITRRVLGDTSSDRVDAMVGAVVEASLGQPQVQMRDEELAAMLETRTFLFLNVYQRPEIVPEVESARITLRTVCDWYRAHPEALPEEGVPDTAPDVAVVDYVAGMTDRFALREFERIGLKV